MNAINEFEKRFTDQLIELLILTNESVGGGAVVGDFLRPSLGFIASLDLKTDVLSHKRGRLEWMIKNSSDRVGWGYNFEQYGIYRIKARKNIPINLETNMLETLNNCYMVVEVVEENVCEPRLEEIKKQLMKPVIIEEEPLPTFTLNRSFSWFEGTIDWIGDKCSVTLETDVKDGDMAEKAFSALKVLYKEIKEWDKRFRDFVAGEMADQANDWSEEEDGESKSLITESEFAARIRICELSIAPDGELTLYYGDDDMFWGHDIELIANIDGTMLSADIVG